jgi:hypothetical protein
MSGRRAKPLSAKSTHAVLLHAFAASIGVPASILAGAHHIQALLPDFSELILTVWSQIECLMRVLTFLKKSC